MKNLNVSSNFSFSSHPENLIKREMQECRILHVGPKE